MANPVLDPLTAFTHRFARAQASDIVDLPWGFAVLQSDFPSSHDHNRVIVTAPAPAAEVIRATEEILSRAGLSHRYVCVEGDVIDDSLFEAFEGAGYGHEAVAVMLYEGPEPAEPAHEVSAVSIETLRPALLRDWRLDLAGSTDDVHRQLTERVALYERGAKTTRNVVFEGDEIAARSDLFVDPAEGLAQFENLATHPDFRGRGYAGSLVNASLRQAQSEGFGRVFLTAVVDDWPIEWYSRLGFVEVGRTHSFTILGS